jgi:hypothetical protein
VFAEVEFPGYGGGDEGGAVFAKADGNVPDGGDEAVGVVGQSGGSFWRKRVGLSEELNNKRCGRAIGATWSVVHWSLRSQSVWCVNGSIGTREARPVPRRAGGAPASHAGPGDFHCLAICWTIHFAFRARILPEDFPGGRQGELVKSDGAIVFGVR